MISLTPSASFRDDSVLLGDVTLRDFYRIPPWADCTS
jgi:hypothetical protein